MILGTITKKSSFDLLNEYYEAEPIERIVERVTYTNEPIEETAPLIYTERKDGVLPQYDIRTDTADLAIEAMELVTKNHLMKREQRIAEREKQKNETQQNNNDN